MKINIEATPQEIAELLQAIESSKEQMCAMSYLDLGSTSVELTNIPSIEETLKAKSCR